MAILGQTLKLWETFCSGATDDTYSLGSLNLRFKNLFWATNGSGASLCLTSSSLLTTTTITNKLSASGYYVTRTTVTTAYTPILTNDVISCDGTFAVTLPNAVCTGKTFSIRNMGTGTITVSGSGGVDVIDGQTSQTLSQYECLYIINDSGGSWGVI